MEYRIERNRREWICVRNFILLKKCQNKQQVRKERVCVILELEKRIVESESEMQLQKQRVEGDSDSLKHSFFDVLEL